MGEGAGEPALAGAAGTGDQDVGARADPGAVGEAEDDAAGEAAGADQVDVLEAGVLVAQPGLLETPLEGAGAAFVDLAVDEEREAVLEGHVVEVVAGHLFEEGGQHAGQAQGSDAFGEGVGEGHVKASGPRMFE